MVRLDIAFMGLSEYLRVQIKIICTQFPDQPPTVITMPNVATQMTVYLGPIAQNHFTALLRSEREEDVLHQHQKQDQAELETTSELRGLQYNSCH